jgi:hypothetical protein
MVETVLTFKGPASGPARDKAATSSEAPGNKRTEPTRQPFANVRREIDSEFLDFLVDLGAWDLFIAKPLESDAEKRPSKHPGREWSDTIGDLRVPW